MEPTIISGTGTICISSNKDRAKRIEAAMQQAILDATAAGITDPEEIRKRLLAAKESF